MHALGRGYGWVPSDNTHRASRTDSHSVVEAALFYDPLVFFLIFVAFPLLSPLRTFLQATSIGGEHACIASVRGSNSPSDAIYT